MSGAQLIGELFSVCTRGSLVTGSVHCVQGWSQILPNEFTNVRPV